MTQQNRLDLSAEPCTLLAAVLDVTQLTIHQLAPSAETQEHNLMYSYTSHICIHTDSKWRGGAARLRS